MTKVHFKKYADKTYWVLYGNPKKPVESVGNIVLGKVKKKYIEPILCPKEVWCIEGEARPYNRRRDAADVLFERFAQNRFLTEE